VVASIELDRLKPRLMIFRRVRVTVQKPGPKIWGFPQLAEVKFRARR